MIWEKYICEDYEKKKCLNNQQNHFMNTFSYLICALNVEPIHFTYICTNLFAQTLFVCVWGMFSICANRLKKNCTTNLLCKHTNILTVYVAV